MRQLFTLIILTLTTHLTYGQECGIYRIKYVGSIKSEEKKIITVYLPTTRFLHGLEKKNSKHSFIDTTLTNGMFEMEIGSHLTTPYNDIEQLLTLYKKQSKKLKIKVGYLENEILKKTFLEIDWDDIKISIIKDDKFGTLFEFNFGDIKF